MYKISEIVDQICQHSNLRRKQPHKSAMRVEKYSSCESKIARMSANGLAMTAANYNERKNSRGWGYHGEQADIGRPCQS